MAAIKMAPCPHDHERLKWTRAWSDLELVGVQAQVDDWPPLELRNCTCGTTLGRPVPPPVQTSAQLAEVTLDATDALAVGQTMRSLARDKKTPPGVRELLARVGSQITAAARVALTKGGAL